MDLATLFGVILGTGLVVGAIVAGPGAVTFVHVPSLMITLGGTIAATLINFPLGKVMGVFSVARNALFHRLPDTKEQIERMVQLARVTRAEGLLGMENSIEGVTDPFLRKAVQFAVDGTDPDVLRTMLEDEIDQTRGRHLMGKNILDSMGAAAPAWGMVGTLIGLVQMLCNMSDPSSIGSGMATALITTFYGAIMANLVFIPVAGKLDTRSKEEVLSRTIILEGISGIQKGLTPRLLEEKLKALIEPKVREKIISRKAAA